MTNQIHPTAIVAPGANLGRDNDIGPYAIIEDDVVLGDNNHIAAHACVKSGTRMGNKNTLREQAVLGGLPQHLGFSDKSIPTYLVIGDENEFCESVVVQRAYQEGKQTQIGSHNYLMCLTHIGHDCQIGNHITFAPGMAIGGHVNIDDYVFISGGVMVHQFVNIGRYAMVGGNTKITQDVLPFMMTDGNPAFVRGLNLVGLKRAGFSRDDIRTLKQAYRLLFQSGALTDNLQAISAISHHLVEHLLEFVRRAERGFHRVK